MDRSPSSGNEGKKLNMRNSYRGVLEDNRRKNQRPPTSSFSFGPGGYKKNVRVVHCVESVVQPPVMYNTNPTTTTSSTNYVIAPQPPPMMYNTNPTNSDSSSVCVFAPQQFPPQSVSYIPPHLQRVCCLMGCGNYLPDDDQQSKTTKKSKKVGKYTSQNYNLEDLKEVYRNGTPYRVCNECIEKRPMTEEAGRRRRRKELYREKMKKKTLASGQSRCCVQGCWRSPDENCPISKVDRSRVKRKKNVGYGDKKRGWDKLCEKCFEKYKENE